MHVNPLRVLDQLPFQSLGIVDLDDTGRHGEELSQLRRTEASRSGHDLEAIAVGPHGDGLDQAMLPDALGQLVEFGFLEGAAGVGAGFVNGIDGEVLEGAAVLHLSALLEL